MAGTLRPKYKVYRLDEEGAELGPSMLATDPENIDAPFVIFPRKDPAAFHALLAYADVCEKGLRMEIIQFAGKVAESDISFGTQGARNWQTMLMERVKAVEL